MNDAEQAQLEAEHAAGQTVGLNEDWGLTLVVEQENPEDYDIAEFWSFAWRRPTYPGWLHSAHKCYTEDEARGHAAQFALDATTAAIVSTIEVRLTHFVEVPF